MSELSELDTKLLDPTWYHTDDYLEGFKRLRDEDPVHWTEDPVYGKNYWTVTRFEDTEALLLADRDFSNRWDTHAPTTPKRMTPEERYRQGFDVGIAFADNPVHDLYRRPLNRHFSVPAIGKLTEMATREIDGVLDEAIQRGTQDVVNGLALAIPTRVVLQWFGIPDEDWQEVQKNVRRSGRGFAPVSAIELDVDHGDADDEHEAILAYSEAIAADRLASPRDDLISAMAGTKIDGEPVTLHEVTSNVFHLLEGALGNSRNAIAMSIWLLLTHPDQASMLRDDPSLIPDAVDEMLRYSSNSPTRLRIANHDTEFGGKEISAGDWVIAFLKSANFDERVFPNPEVFDITRRPKHLAFGTGIHNCLGRHLARLEMSILIRKLVEDYDVNLAAEPVWGTNAPGSKMLSQLDVSFARR